MAMQEQKNIKVVSIQIVTFRIGEEYFGMPVGDVREIIRNTELFDVPGSGPDVRGVINLRGDVIPIIDLRKKFGLPEEMYADNTRVIVVEVEGKLMGIVVDSVSHVIRIDESQIDKPPLLSGMSREYIMGVVKLDKRLIVLLNIDRILTTEEKIEIEKIEMND